MLFDQIKMLNQFDNNKTNIFLISIHSEEIAEFYQYFCFIKKRIRYLDIEELSESFLFLKSLFNRIRNTIYPYYQVLKDEDLQDIKAFFIDLLNADYEEQTSVILRKLWELIRKFQFNDVENELKKMLEKVYSLKYDDKVVILNSVQMKKSEAYNIINLNRYLTENHYYDNVFFLGTPNYYPRQNTIFKAKNIYFLSYDIYYHELKPKKMVSENNDKYCRFYSGVDVFRDGSASIDAGDEEKEIIPNENSLYLDNWIKKYHSNKNELNQTIQARVVEFVTGEHIFFPINSKVKIFNKKKVSEKSVNTVEESDWIVIKTSSDDDYIRKRAEKMVGDSYQSKFDRVTKYKEELLNYANEQKLNIKELKKVLQKRGIYVEEQLLKQWIFGDTIAPRKYRDVLEFLDYNNETINILEKDYHLILDAHRRAGRELVSNIQVLIEKTDVQQILNKMKKYYTFDFEIKKIGNFSIKEVSYNVDKRVEVDINDLYKVLN